MILAKKYVIGLATDTVVLSTLNAEKKSSQDLIGANASLLHYDMTDYTEFAVCRWPYLSNGNEYPLWLESWFDEENQCWVKTIPDN